MYCADGLDVPDCVEEGEAHVVLPMEVEEEQPSSDDEEGHDPLEEEKLPDPATLEKLDQLDEEAVPPVTGVVGLLARLGIS